MGKKNRNKSDATADTASGPFHQAFASLGALRDDLPAGPPPSATAPPGPAHDPLGPAPSRVVVQKERKGRGGKTVTRVELRGVPADALDAWLQACRRALGCGGAVEDGALVLQGDQRDRVNEWLATRG